MPDWLVFPLLGVLWSPVLVLLHETGHALAALVLTDGEVAISVRGAGILGGRVTYDAARLRRPRGEAWIAAAGPAVSLLAAVVLWFAWLESGSVSLETIPGAGAFVATLQLLTSALPLRYGAGLGGPAESDGLVAWRVMTGSPPGGIERELRRLGEPERAMRPVFLILLLLAGGLAVLADPTIAWVLAGWFGLAALFQRIDSRR